ncbi:MAG: TIGR03960 family B12-binding radical SAM protein [Candidatus Aminicenantes bacterium]|nr:TIGR03960 family B12-binding radical SAM protein [Candidatus Aminicenantes bacterium]
MNREKIKQFILKLQNPQIYSGKEINVVKSDFGNDKVNICLVFPDTYDIGMSHQGMKILYHLLTSNEEVNVERAFLPDKDSIELFKNEDVELFSLESKTPLKHFDMIGFSILSEMSYTNILQVLDLSNIPLYTKERDGEFPLIVSGGITAAANPEPVRDFIDIFAIGDGEILFPEIIKILLMEKKEEKRSLENFKDVQGLYVPSLFNVEKRGRFFTPVTNGGKVKKQVLNSIDSNPFNEGLIVPITSVIFDRLEIEIARGCPQNCRFCQAKSYYSPYRAKKHESIIDELQNSLEHTGFESISLSSLSTGDHPLIEDILESVILEKSPCLSVSLPSLRPSTLTGNVLAALSTGRKTGITIVPEAGSERLRRVINKEVSDEDILSAVRSALTHGWQKIKLYFMIGLPTETDEDLNAVIELIEKIQNESKKIKKNLKIHISFSPFVPKPHTVFQWAKRDSNKEIYRKSGILFNGLKKYRNIDLDFHKPEKGFVETILSRGDHSVGELVYRAFRSGEIFSAWDSEFNYSIWEGHIKDLQLERFLDEFNSDDILPWSFLDFNFTPEYLTEEYIRAIKGETTPSCTDMKCSECKGCGFQYKKNVPSRRGKELSARIQKETVDYNKVRIFYKKTGEFSWLSHLPMMKYIERLIRRSGVRFRCTEGFHPRIKMSSIPPLPVFARGEDEVVELYIDDQVTEDLILNALKKSAGEFLFNSVKIVNDRKNLNKDLKYMLYEINGKSLDSFRIEIEKILLPSDEALFGEDNLELKIDYSDRGAERFSKIYRIIDPEKKRTGSLTRRKIVFKD